MTGANDTGALFSRSGFPAVTMIGSDISQKLQKEKDVVCISTDSRAEQPETARQKVRDTVKKFGDGRMLVCKRIDSTLRGNVGAEIDGILEALPKGWKAVVVPACPGAGRICVGGHVLVHGVALAKSSASQDQKTPVCFSRVEDIIRLQSRRTCATFCLQEIQEGTARLAQGIRESSAEILIFDALDHSDIETIAAACQETDLPVVCVDPGDFSVEMALCRFPYAEASKSCGISLLVIGSISVVTRRQVAYLQKKRLVKLCTVRIHSLLETFELEKNRLLEETSKVSEAVWDAGKGSPKIICLITESTPVALNCTEAEEVARRLAKLGLAVMEQNRENVRCAYLSGGDVAKYFLEFLEPDALELVDEIFPLAVYGRVIGGTWDCLQILTKGGMIGQEDTLERMLCYAEQKRNYGS